jgi:hypothetical protein
VKQIVCALSLAFLVSCGSPTPQVAAPTVLPAVATVAPVIPTVNAGPAPVGARVEQGVIALTVAKVGRKDELGALKPKEGNEYVIAEVVIETVDGNPAPYNPFYFKVKDGSGVEYNSTLNIEANALKSGDLPKGDKVRGTVAFEVPKGVSGLILYYEPLVIGSPGPIRIALG